MPDKPKRTYTMRQSFTIFLAALLLVAGCGQKEKLFNGKNLDGWVCVTATPDEHTFAAQGGVLHVTGTPMGYIRTEKKYSDFTLRLEWRWGASRVDSGIFVFLQEGDKVWPTGVQLQLRESDFGYFFSGLALEGVDGPFYRKAPLCDGDPERPDGEWNQVEIVCRGGHITATVNGILVNEADCEASAGYIGLQSEGGAIDFRNITVE